MYEGEKYTSETIQYLYYETPMLVAVEPSCGPVSGYTQIEIVGKNFIDMGFGKAKCVFNDTIWMNATIISQDLI